MASFVQLFGGTLRSKSGTVETVRAVDGKCAIAVYFGAHWCPSCREFTRELDCLYIDTFAGKGLEVVFVSSDEDETAFDEYCGEQPWLALPFLDRDRKQILTEKLNVKGIPMVVILDAEGKVINRDAGSMLLKDPEGKNFPWRAFELPDVLQGLEVTSRSGDVQSFGSLPGKATALFFGAGWCPSCVDFSTDLAEWYEADLRERGLDVVFVSSDESEDDFREYFAKQPWHALDHSNRQSKRILCNMLDIVRIPCLVILDKDGVVINMDGASAILEDRKGTHFPWRLQPVRNLRDGIGNLSRIPTVVAFCEACNMETKRTIEAAMTPVGKRFFASRSETVAYQTSTGCYRHCITYQEVAFCIITESSAIGSRLRCDMNLVSLPPCDESCAASETPSVEQPPRLMLIDIPDGDSFYEGPEGEITEDVVLQFVVDYKRGKLARKQLQD